MRKTWKKMYHLIDHKIRVGEPTRHLKWGHNVYQVPSTNSKSWRSLTGAFLYSIVVWCTWRFGFPIADGAVENSAVRQILFQIYTMLFKPADLERIADILQMRRTTSTLEANATPKRCAVECCNGRILRGGMNTICTTTYFPLFVRCTYLADFHLQYPASVGFKVGVIYSQGKTRKLELALERKLLYTGTSSRMQYTSPTNQIFVRFYGFSA